jgi:integrase
MTSRHQSGYVWRVGQSWYGRWYRDEIVNGAVVRRQHSEKLCAYGNQYRSKKDVRPLLDEKLKPVNTGRSSATSTLNIAEYVERFYFPYVESELKASTVHGYKGLWRMYLKPRLANVSLRDFTCGQTMKLLADIYQGHKLSRKSLRHCKALVQTIFSHAIQTDVLQGNNPVQGAKIPKAAQPAGDTYAYSTSELMAMLNTLEGTARAAIGVMYFLALRPGEARGAKWSDYEKDKRILRVRRSVWRKHETLPKTEESVAPVHVPEVLADILSELADLPCSSDYILATPSGRPIDLHNLAARTIKPSLERCAVCQILKAGHAKAGHEFERDPKLPEWRGFYALRRGIGTALADVDNALAAKSHLRHANVATTTAHYIKSVDAAAIRAVDKISDLFDNAIGSSIPN